VRRRGASTISVKLKDLLASRLGIRAKNTANGAAVKVATEETHKAFPPLQTGGKKLKRVQKLQTRTRPAERTNGKEIARTSRDCRVVGSRISTLQGEGPRDHGGRGKGNERRDDSEGENAHD